MCTPQQVALLDAIKAVDMYQKVNVPILGFVENMTGDIFGRGGVQKVAQELKIPFLGEIPLNLLASTLVKLVNAVLPN